ncbi:MAG: hypothetical protein WC693_03660 [Patescibacteria group bacterium]|jgi:hypothetical protein
MSKPKGTAQIYERRDSRDILCPADATVGFSATKEGGQIRITNRSASPIVVAERRRPVPPGHDALVQKDVPLKIGEHTYICR